MPTISVLLAVHNGGRYLREAIESISEQSFSDWELLIVDNASSDETLEVARDASARDHRIRVYSLAEKGKNRAYNFAFAQATGRYVTFFAADDVLPPDSLERRMRALEGHGPSAYATCCLRTFSADPTYDGVVFPRNVRKPNHSGGSLFFTRELANQLFPLPESQPNEDTWASLHLRAFGENHHVPEPLYLYRIHPGNSYGYGLSFDAKRTEYLRRMHAYRLFLETHGDAAAPFLDAEVRPFLKGLEAAHSRDILGILRVRRLKLGSKLVLIMYCSEILYKARHTYFRALSGGIAR